MQTLAPTPGSSIMSAMPQQETLSSRERVIRTLRRQPVDRMPIDLGMHPSSGISAYAYQNLRKHLGLDADQVWVPDAVQMLAMVDEDIRQRFHLDCIMLEPRWPTLRPWTPREGYRFLMPSTMPLRQDASGDWYAAQGDRQMHMPAGGYFFDGDWLSNWGGLSPDDALNLYAREARRIYEETPYATCFVGYSYGGGMPSYFDGFDQAMQMMEEPDAVKAGNERRLEWALGLAQKVISKFGKYLQMIAVGNDMGMQSGPMCRPSLMEEFVFPYYKRFCSFIHESSDIKVFMHNCGSIRAYLPMIIDAGIDVINPVQISAADMDPATLKREFGDRITFWGGGCDTQNILGAASPSEVAQHVRQQIDIFKPRGGFVFNQVHNIMGNVPPQNIVAMLDTAYAQSWSN